MSAGKKFTQKKKTRVQLNSLPIYRRALLSERLEQAKSLQKTYQSSFVVYSGPQSHYIEKKVHKKEPE